MENKKLFSRDFTLVVIGQIISLFGNGVLRFALPLYLLNQRHSSVLFGLVTACSFIPMIILSPIGGIIADRVNKRNVMVVLDFSAALLTLVCMILLGKVDLVVLLLISLIILYGIQGTYQPTVQASIPALVSNENLVSGNAVINLITSLSNLLGPVVGGAVYGFFGIKPVLLVCIVCFFSSSFMEIFINIPFKKEKIEGNVFKIGFADIKESILFIKHDQPVIAKVCVYLALLNLFFSALIIIGLPVIITQNLGFSEDFANQIYGYCQGALAAGGLVGGILTGTLLKNFNIKKCHYILFICALLVLPIGFALLFNLSSMVTYAVIVISCFFSMMASTIFMIVISAFAQRITPKNLVGKIMALAICMAMCAIPLGQALYGWLFELLKNYMYVIFFAVAIITAVIAFMSDKTFTSIKSDEN